MRELFGLQGVIRSEIGFEIVLCDFSENLEIVSNITLKNATTLGDLPNEPEFAHSDLERKRMALMDQWQLMSGYDWLEAGSRVNEGELRILLDFSGMVTPLNKTYIDRDPYKRRINNIPDTNKEEIIHLLELYLTSPVDPFHKTDWQAVTEATGKFATILIALNSTLQVFELESEGEILGPSIESAAGNLTLTLFNFFRRYMMKIWIPGKKRNKTS